jgi:ketosteroid isomerase-like protein
MRKHWTIGIWAMVALCAASLARADADEKAVNDAAGRFYSALNVLFTGDAAPMKAVWSHQPDVTYMGPGGGFQVGWESVSAVWDAQAARKLGGAVHPSQTHTVVGADLAIVSNYEEGENTNAGGKTETVSIRATNVFRKEQGAWKMIGHHTDLLPFLEK